MKRLRLIVLVCAMLFAVDAAAQSVYVMQSGTRTPQTCPNGFACSAAVDANNNVYVTSSGTPIPVVGNIPLTNSATGPNGVGSLVVGAGLVTLDAIEAGSTATVLNLTSHVAVRGDVIRFPALSSSPPTVRTWGVVCSTTTNTVTLCDALGFTPVAAQDVSISRNIPAGAAGNSSTGSTSLNVNLDANAQGSAATGILKLEDSVAATGDAGVMSLGVTNETRSTRGAANDDYIAPALNQFGAAFIEMPYLFTSGSPLQYFYRSEDDTIANQTTVVLNGFQTQDPLTIDQGANGDVAIMKGDRAGRQITAPYAPPGEYFSSCSAEITGTSRTAVKAAVASNRIYVTSVTCGNNSAVASRMSFTDGAGAALASGGVGTLAATGGDFTASFPVPLRGSVNTDFSVTMTTTATATICCANGYISVN